MPENTDKFDKSDIALLDALKKVSSKQKESEPGKNVYRGVRKTHRHYDLEEYPYLPSKVGPRIEPKSGPPIRGQRPKSGDALVQQMEQFLEHIQDEEHEELAQNAPAVPPISEVELYCQFLLYLMDMDHDAGQQTILNFVAGRPELSEKFNDLYMQDQAFGPAASAFLQDVRTLLEQLPHAAQLEKDAE